jgi:hypothetical protein
MVVNGYRWVFNAFPESVFRNTNLSFNHHKVAVGLEDVDRNRWLKLGELIEMDGR